MNIRPTHIIWIMKVTYYFQTGGCRYMINQYDVHQLDKRVYKLYNMNVLQRNCDRFPEAG